MSELMARMERWAIGLPNEDSIPVCDSEVFELAFHINEGSILPCESRLRLTLDQLQRGGFIYMGHKVVIL